MLNIEIVKCFSFLQKKEQFQQNCCNAKIVRGVPMFVSTQPISRGSYFLQVPRAPLPRMYDTIYFLPTKLLNRQSVFDFQSYTLHFLQKLENESISSFGEKSKLYSLLEQSQF